MNLFSKDFLFAAAFAAFFAGCGESSSSPNIDSSSSSATSSVEASSESRSSSSVETSSESSSESGAESSAAADTEISTQDAWRDSCVAIINAYRESVNVKSIVRNVDKESCTDAEAAADLSENSAHGHFGNCGEFAQNSGPNISTAYFSDEFKIVQAYLLMMWKEKELADAGDTVYMNIGHYLNMKNSQVESVACGIAYSEDGKTAWFNVNFF